MTPNTMTLDEVRDELAKLNGWSQDDNLEFDDEDGRTFIAYTRYVNNKRELSWGHPHPATLDGAAAALLTEYVWCRYLDDPEMENGWYAWKRAYYNTSQSVPDTGDELLDRYRLALSCRLAEVKQ